MTQGTPGEGRILLFYCTRQNPADFAGFKAVMLAGDWVTVEVPCSGRVGTGEIMQGLAEPKAATASARQSTSRRTNEPEERR